MPIDYVLDDEDVALLRRLCSDYVGGRLTAQTQLPIPRKPPLPTYVAITDETIGAYVEGDVVPNGDVDIYTINDSGFLSGPLLTFTAYNLGTSIDNGTNVGLIRDPFSGAYFALPVTTEAGGGSLTVEDNATPTPNVYTGITEIEVKTGVGSTTLVQGLTLGNSGTTAIIGVDNFYLLGIHNTSSGSYSTAIGYKNTSNSAHSQAIGYQNTAGTSNFSVAIGNNNSANGGTSSAVGQGCTAAAQFDASFGTNCDTNGGVAFGYSNTALGGGSVAIGSTCTASIAGTTAVGLGCNAASGTAIGNDCTIFGTSGGLAMGVNSTASASYSNSIGTLNTASNLGASAIGYVNTASGVFSSAIGKGCLAEASQSSAVGYLCVSGHTGAQAFGWGTTTTAGYGTEIGYQAFATTGNKIRISASGIVPIGSPSWCSSDGSAGITTTLTTATGVATFKEGLLVSYTGS